jgi:16S rRNA (cytidine1402-2'-O)-methyltransferase
MKPGMIQYKPSAKPDKTGLLKIVATPVGNLGDLSPRAADALAKADIIACEDTRQTRKLLQLCQIDSPARLLAYHDHNGAKMRPKLLAALQQGQQVALVSDAGTPLISDPGYKLVTACHEAGIAVTSLPGPAAPIIALSMAGLPSDRFVFQGFVPDQTGRAKSRIAESAGWPITQIWFESPRRLAMTLQLMAEMLGPREAVVARELTKLHEELHRGTLVDLAAYYQEHGPPKGELVLLIGPAAAAPPDAAELTGLLEQALASQSLKDSVAAVAEATGMPRRDIYRLALSLERPADG